MGEVIRKTAAADDIIADIKETYINAKAKGGKWQALAEERVAPIVTLVDTVVPQLADARATAAPILAALDAEDVKADLLIGNSSDIIWNALERPRSDPWFEILFPGGNAFYVDGDVTEQPDRMDLLVQLLNAGIHPKLPTATANSVASSIHAAAISLRGKVDAARVPRTKVVLLERVKGALARAAAIELANFKRILKANGFSEAEIHAVIPDRSRPAPKKAAEGASSPAAETPPAKATP